MPLDLHDRTACITGATTGIGLGIARAFAQAGARLVINSHVDDDASAAALAELQALTECAFVQADLSSADGPQILIDAAHNRLGPLNTLVCNAGTFRDHAFADNTPADYEATFNLNVRGYLNAAQAFAAQCPAGGSILCIGSTNSKAAEKDSVYYDTSKGAVLMMIRSLAVSLAGQGIRVNGVGPGIVATPLTAPGLDVSGVRDTLKRQIPLGRIGETADIGGAAAFLCSPQAGYITGQMLYVDGGILAQQMSWG